MTDRELDVAVAKALGCSPRWISADYRCKCFKGVHGEENYKNELKSYSRKWQHAGPLLEMMPNTALIHATGTEPLVWECITESDLKDGRIRQGLHETSPTRAICEAFLKWQDSDPEGFKKATGQ